MLTLWSLVLVALLLAACGAPVEPPVRTLLVTAFGPFGTVESNPSWEAARVLDGARLPGWRVRVVRLDVVYETAAGQLSRALQETRPEAVLALGVAPGDALCVETVARNRDDSPHPDNEGVIRTDRAIREGGPSFLPTRLPVRAILDALEKAGYEVRTSENAGGYLCNHVFYWLVDVLPEHIPAGFVHVPPIAGDWDLERLRAAVQVAVAAVTTAG